MADKSIDERLAAIEAAIPALSTKADVADLRQLLARQLAAIQAIQSDVRILAGIAQSNLTALGALLAGYTDLSGRITDLENPAP